MCKTFRDSWRFIDNENMITLIWWSLLKATAMLNTRLPCTCLWKQFSLIPIRCFQDPKPISRKQHRYRWHWAEQRSLSTGRLEFCLHWFCAFQASLLGIVTFHADTAVFHCQASSQVIRTYGIDVVFCFGTFNVIRELAKLFFTGLFGNGIYLVRCLKLFWWACSCKTFKVSHPADVLARALLQWSQKIWQHFQFRLPF